MNFANGTSCEVSLGGFVLYKLYHRDSANFQNPTLVTEFVLPLEVARQVSTQVLAATEPEVMASSRQEAQQEAEADTTAATALAPKPEQTPVPTPGA
jgi:hypothetical protein